MHLAQNPSHPSQHVISGQGDPLGTFDVDLQEIESLKRVLGQQSAQLDAAHCQRAGRATHYVRSPGLTGQSVKRCGAVVIGERRRRQRVIGIPGHVAFRDPGDHRIGFDGDDFGVRDRLRR